jgi:hypothetical protein
MAITPKEGSQKDGSPKDDARKGEGPDEISVPNIWSKYELEKRQQRATKEHDDTSLRNYLTRAKDSRHRWVDRREVEIERAEEESRRYGILQLMVRGVHADWTADAVRQEALRLLKLERAPGPELVMSYLPKPKTGK